MVTGSHWNHCLGNRGGEWRALGFGFLHRPSHVGLRFFAVEDLFDLLRLVSLLGGDGFIHFFNAQLGSAESFWLYALICVAGFVLIFARLPETEGKSLEHIERKLVEK